MTEKLIYESKKSKIYLLENSEFGHPVLLKSLNYEFPTPKDIAQFYNEFEIINGLGLKGVRNSHWRAFVKRAHLFSYLHNQFN